MKAVTTWSPSLRSVTPGPTLMTMPEPSCPPRPGKPTGVAPVTRCSSEWHRPDAASSTMTSPAAGRRPRSPRPTTSRPRPTESRPWSSRMSFLTSRLRRRGIGRTAVLRVTACAGLTGPSRWAHPRAARMHPCASLGDTDRRVRRARGRGRRRAGGADGGAAARPPGPAPCWCWSGTGRPIDAAPGRAPGRRGVPRRCRTPASPTTLLAADPSDGRPAAAGRRPSRAGRVPPRPRRRDERLAAGVVRAPARPRGGAGRRGRRRAADRRRAGRRGHGPGPGRGRRRPDRPRPGQRGGPVRPRRRGAGLRRRRQHRARPDRRVDARSRSGRPVAGARRPVGRRAAGLARGVPGVRPATARRRSCRSPGTGTAGSAGWRRGRRWRTLRRRSGWPRCWRPSTRRRSRSSGPSSTRSARRWPTAGGPDGCCWPATPRT